MRGCEDSVVQAFAYLWSFKSTTNTLRWVHLKALACTWGHAYANFAIYWRDNAILIYDAKLIINSRLAGSAWFSL